MKCQAIVATLSLLSLPAHALSLQEVYEQLGGLECSGNTCTESETISTEVELPDIETVVELPDVETIVELPDTVETIDNPDVVSSTEVEVPSNISEDPGSDTVTIGCLKVTMAGNPIPADRLSFFCTGNNSLSPLRGGGFPTTKVVTAVVDGGTTDVLVDGGTEVVLVDGGTEVVLVDGGTTVVETCETTTYTVSHPGGGHGHGIPQGGWSIDEETSESAGPC